MGLVAVAGRMTEREVEMENAFDSTLLPDAFGACACCVRESLDAAGVSLDCAHAMDEGGEDAWRLP